MLLGIEVHTINRTRGGNAPRVEKLAATVARHLFIRRGKT
jgi:hypothetical protein